MLQNACYCGTTAFSGFYCKVCCSMNSVGTNAFAADQPIQLRARQTNGQQTDAFFVVFFFLYRAEFEKLRTQSSETVAASARYR